MTTETKSVEKSRTTPQTRAQAAPAREWGRVYVPPVDIYENDDHVAMQLDMPGVAEKSADVTVENRVLTIEGQVDLDVPAGCELVRAECQASGYRRVFELSDEIDVSGIKALLKNGVMQVTLPKHEEAKSRKIDITVES